MPAGQHRTIAKHSYLTGKDKGFGRAKAHINYIQFRAGKDQEKEERSFFNAYRDDIYNKELKEAISDQNPRGTVMHKIILSPGVEGADIKEYARDVMTELCSKKGQDLEWYAVAHGNTDNAHCHIVVMGRDENGRDVRIYKKDYEVIKEAGDQYLERHKLLERHKDRDKEKDDRVREEREKEWQKEDQERTEHRTSEDAERKEQREEEDKRIELERQQEDKERDKELSDELAESRVLQDEERQLERERQDKDRAELRVKEDQEKELLRTRERETQRIEREKADRDREREPEGKGAANLLFEALKAAAKEFARTMGKEDKEKEPDKKETEYQKRKREKDEEKDRERSLLGDDLDIDAKLLLEQKSEERQKADKEKAWKEYIKSVEIAYPLPDGSTQSFKYDRANSLESLKELSKDYEDKKEIARASLSEEDHKRVKSWINEKNRENKRIEEKAEKMPKIAVALDSENRETWSKESSLEDLRRLEEMNKRREVYLDEAELKALDNWINAQELKEPIRIELERADGPLLYERDDSEAALSLLLEEYETGKQEDISKKDYEKLKTWLDEKDVDRNSPPAETSPALPAERISIYEEAENQHYHYDRESELSELRGLANDFLRDESQLSQREFKELKVWIADKEYVEAEKARERADKEREEAARQKEIAEKEAPILVFEPAENRNHEYDRNSNLEELQVLQASNEREEIALSEKQAEKLKDWIAEKEREKWERPIEYADRANLADPDSSKAVRQVSKDDKLETLQKLEKACSDGSKDAPKLKEEDHERLKEWIKDKNEKEIEYGDQVYSKETPLKELEQFRQDLVESKYEHWIEKEKFSQLCSWIGTKEREQKEKDAKELAAKEVKEPTRRPARESRTKSGSTKTGKESKTDAEDRDLDEDAIKYDGQVYSKETPLAELKEFRDGLLGKRFDQWIEKDQFSKLSSWVATKEAYGEDAYKNREKDKAAGKARTRGEDKDVYVPKRKMSALEKRMQRAVRQEKAERLKSFYEEKALQRERIEKELHEIKWDRMSANKPVLQFVNLLRKGANKLKEEKEREAKIKERDLEWTGQKELKTEKPIPKGEAKPTAKPVALPYPEPKSHLEKLANKMALERAQLNKTKAELDREIEKKTGGKIPDKLGKETRNPDKPKESKVKDREEKKRDDDRGGR